jgi:hypothetical protein
MRCGFTSYESLRNVHDLVCVNSRASSGSISGIDGNSRGWSNADGYANSLTNVHTDICTDAHSDFDANGCASCTCPTAAGFTRPNPATGRTGPVADDYADNHPHRVADIDT